MQITTNTLLAISPHANASLVGGIAAALNKWLPTYGMTNKLVVQHFLAQCAEESDGFKTMHEYASGAAYNGRKDLGNVHPGDGPKYKGRGMIETTGFINYDHLAKLWKIDLLNHPELLEGTDLAVRSACEFWTGHHLSGYALSNDIVSITRRINGGLNGLDTRKVYLTRTQRFITSDIDGPKNA